MTVSSEIAQHNEPRSKSNNFLFAPKLEYSKAAEDLWDVNKLRRRIFAIVVFSSGNLIAERVSVGGYFT